MQKSKIALVLVMAACLGLLVSCGIAANGEIPDGAVTTVKIADGAVTTVKIADENVTSAKIADGAIVNADISGAANIDPAKISGMGWTAANDGSGSGLDADMLDGNDANFFWNPANDGSGSGLDADMLDGNDANFFWNPANDGSGSGLDADTVDGKHASDFYQPVYDGYLGADDNVTITIPHYTLFTLQLSSESPEVGGVAFVQGFENDRYIGITYTKYNGDGTSGYGGAEGHESSTTTLLTFGSGSYNYTVECPGEATGNHNLVLTASGYGLKYRLIY
jgi:hypothetical protein